MPKPVLKETLAQAFLSLLDLMISYVRQDEEFPPGNPSYNVILTLEHLHLIPRRREMYPLKTVEEELSVNSLGFAGLLLVKNEALLEAVKKEEVLKILGGVGVKNMHDQQMGEGLDFEH